MDGFNFFLAKDVPIKMVEDYYQALVDSGAMKHRHPSLMKPTVKDAIDSIFVKDTNTMFLVDMEILAISTEVTMNNYQGRSCSCHFTVHPDLIGKAVEVGKITMEKIFKLTRVNGGPYLNTLVGLIPETNRLANRYIQKLGFKQKLIIPDAFYLARFDRYDNGILSLRTR